MTTPNRLGMRQTLTPHLALNAGLVASLGVLRADVAGLTRYLEEQAAQNPHLRLEPPPQAAAGEWLPRWDFLHAPGGGASADLVQSAAPSLLAHVMERIEAMFRSPRARTIATHLAEALEPSGWLGRPLGDIAREAGTSLPEVEAVLLRLQTIEPAGLFARNLAECLRLQLQEAGQMDATFAEILAHLDLLASGDIARLARRAQVTEAEILRRFRIIRALDPKPGTQFEGLSAEPLREPDLLATRDPQGGWNVTLNRSALPALRIEKVKGGDAAALAAARALGRMVEARNATLLRVAREVLLRQEAALAGGCAALRPLRMAEVAAALDLAESTVSRVVSGTSVDTPLGTWWLRRLFSGGLAAGEDGAPGLSAAALRERLVRFIAAEPPGAPHSDAAIAAYFAAQGTPLARRTVAKYRDMMGIAPAHRRRRRSADLP